ncbi:MAG TPA: cytochrome c-type biogenesis CcmF C-terminal domain-containing protein, partial [Anaerolineales bacterium]|nr:cytochrome c-type biogenesis CcmF C-terminal domain-containing protein [Anaerolineales bacterium]
PDLRGETEMKSVLSREALFLLNNLLFISVLVVCFWGVVFPIISQLFTGQTVTVGPPFYQTAVAPLFAGLMLLMGVAPLSAWGHSSLKTLGRAIWKSALAALVITAISFFAYTNNPIALIGFFLVALVLFVTVQEFWRATSARMRAQNENLFTAFWRLVGRDRRRYGGYVIHISMMLMAIGILGINLFQVQTQGTVSENNSLALSGYTVKYDSMAQFPGPDGQQVTRAVVSVYQGQNYLGDLYPRIDYYPTQEQNMTIPGERSTLKDDLYIILVDWQPTSTNGATFKIFVNPLVNWLWIGAVLFLFGIFIAAWPERDPQRIPVRTRHVKQAESRQTNAAD